MSDMKTGSTFRFDGTHYVCDAREGDRLLAGPDGRIWIINQNHAPRLIEQQSDGSWLVRDIGP